jgi:hypothetical protein
VTTVLPWLDKTARAQVVARLKNTASMEIEKRHWGTMAKGSSPGGGLRLYILDIRGLFLVAGVLRYTLRFHASGVLYRGQCRDWQLQPSLLRDANTKREISSRLTWLTSALAGIESLFDPIGTADEREALAQHYGLPTRWLDVVDNVQTAAWFAYHRSPTDPPGRDDSVRYIYALAYPLAGGAATALDLRLKSSEWLRPHIQQAWCVRASDAMTNLGRLSHLHLATFIVPRPLLAEWCSLSALPPHVMLPNAIEDSGLRYWQRAQDSLKAKGLLPVPW